MSVEVTAFEVDATLSFLLINIKSDLDTLAEGAGDESLFPDYTLLFDYQCPCPLQDACRSLWLNSLISGPPLQEEQSNWIVVWVI